MKKRIKTLASILESNGLDDVKLLIINSRDVSSVRELPRLLSTVNGSNVQVIQETNESKIWSPLGGHRGDIFVYDRCGRLTYYIPNPLSILTSTRPIIQATILSTYFDNPCGVDCSIDYVDSNINLNSNLLPSNNISMHNTLKYISSHTRTQSNVTSNDTVSVENVTNFTATSNVIINNNNDNENDELDDQIEQENHNIYDTNTTINDVSNNTHDNSSLFQPWKIFEFFLNSIKDDSSSSSVRVEETNVVTSAPSINVSLDERAEKISTVTSDELTLMNSSTIQLKGFENNRDGKKFTINSMSSGNMVTNNTLKSNNYLNVNISILTNVDGLNLTINTNEDRLEKEIVTTVQSNVLQDNLSSNSITIHLEGEENKSDTMRNGDEKEERGRSISNLSNADDNDNRYSNNNHNNNNNNNNNSESNNNTSDNNESLVHGAIVTMSNCHIGVQNTGQLSTGTNTHHVQNTTNEFTSSSSSSSSSASSSSDVNFTDSTINVDQREVTVTSESNDNDSSSSPSSSSPSSPASINSVSSVGKNNSIVLDKNQLIDSNRQRNCNTTDNKLNNNNNHTSVDHVAIPIECDASKCIDFSTDKMLRARLCCMKEDDFTSETSTSSKTGCASYTKSTCSQMLPLIKCCLKDFKELLAQYFNSQRSIHNSSVHSNNFFG